MVFSAIILFRQKFGLTVSIPCESARASYFRNDTLTEATYKEFKRNVFAVDSENYDGEDVGPFEYAIRRGKFEEAKLQRLMALAEQTDFSTAKRKVAGWRRQLQRTRGIIMRLEGRKKEARVISKWGEALGGFLLRVSNPGI